MQILEIEPGIEDFQEQEAQALKQELADNHVLYINLMSSPGSGKTTVLLKLLEKLRPDFRCGIIEADIDSQIDASRLEKAGYKTIQVYTDNPSYMDSSMSRQSLEALGLEDMDMVFLEGAGTPVSSAEVDSGSHGDILVFSIPEGADKPQKYPLLFKNCDLLVINKVDVLPYFDFDMDQFKASVRMLNPRCPILEVSAREDQGIDDLADWVRLQYKKLEPKAG